MADGPAPDSGSGDPRPTGGAARSEQPQGSETADLAWSIVSYLLSGLLVWGAAGWLADRLAGTSPVLTVVGLLLGIGSAMYLVVVRISRL